MIKKYSTPDEILFAAGLIRSKELCYHFGSIRDWCIEEWDAQQYERRGEPVPPEGHKRIKTIYIYYLDDNPIACFVLLTEKRWRGHNCGIFVKKEHRLQGIGRALVRQAETDGCEIHPWVHEMGAHQFYSKSLTKLTPVS